MLPWCCMVVVVCKSIQAGLRFLLDAYPVRTGHRVGRGVFEVEVVVVPRRRRRPAGVLLGGAVVVDDIEGTKNEKLCFPKLPQGSEASQLSM